MQLFIFSGRLPTLYWKFSTSCCGTMTPSLQTLSRRWSSCRVNRSRPTSPPATASCSIYSTTHPCWGSASVCWKKVYASWITMLPSLVREHSATNTVRQERPTVYVRSEDMLCYFLFTGKKLLESAVLHCLCLLDLTLQKEVVFMDLLRESQASLLVSPLEQLLQGVSPQTRRADHIVNIAR